MRQSAVPLVQNGFGRAAEKLAPIIDRAQAYRGPVLAALAVVAAVIVLRRRHRGILSCTSPIAADRPNAHRLANRSERRATVARDAAHQRQHRRELRLVGGLNITATTPSPTKKTTTATSTTVCSRSPPARSPPAPGGFRRHGVTEDRDWTFEESRALVTKLNGLNQLALAEVARIAEEQGFAQPAV